MIPPREHITRLPAAGLFSDPGQSPLAGVSFFGRGLQNSAWPFKNKNYHFSALCLKAIFHWLQKIAGDRKSPQNLQCAVPHFPSTAAFF